MLISDYLARNALLYAEKVALVERKNNYHEYEKFGKTERRALTWSELNDRANQVANFLLLNGMEKGDKVAIMMPNCLEWLPIYFGTLRAGMVAVPLNVFLDLEELRHCLFLSECKVLFFWEKCVDTVFSILSDTLVQQFIFIGKDCPEFAKPYTIVESITVEDPNICLSESDHAVIYFSSGTTGFPKAILHAHKSLVEAAKTEKNHHGQTCNDIFLCIPPFYHIGAGIHWLGSLISGSSAVLLCDVSPKFIFEAVSQERVTIVWLLLPWAQDILCAIEDKDLSKYDYDLSCWRLTHMGAQSIPASLIRGWRKQFPLQDFDVNYGLTEACGPGCVHLGVENMHKIGAIGKPGYQWDAAVFDINMLIRSHHEVGELAVKGSSIMLGYYKNNVATAAVLKEGWLFTGDLAYKDEDGFFYLVGRKDDLIISSGENIYPAQIENHIRKHPAVNDVAVIGLPNERVGEIITAIIEVKPDRKCDLREIKKFCMELPANKRPQKVFFLELPRSASGKIKKKELKDILVKI